MQQGVWGGDFNMVLNMNDTTSMHSVVAAQEANVWDGMSTEHHLLDAWLAGSNSAGYTFHSKSHILSWSRLDRFYFIGHSWLPSRCIVHVQMQMHMSDHFPICLDLIEVDEVNVKAGSTRPFLINNSLLHVKSLHHNVKSLIHKAQALKMSKLDFWMYICDGMQECIRVVGKEQAQKQKRKLQGLHDRLKPLLDLVLAGRDNVQVCREIEGIKGALLDIAKLEVAKHRHKCRIRELSDSNDTSKGFYNKLKSKHRREGFHTLSAEDGSETTDCQ
ncbi:hypothetical protein L7F22_066697 [Adiantum nelumboides]|nr:hypothetical protein [Adiantum nelumboides]